jgi:hypothetical protein
MGRFASWRSFQAAASTGCNARIKRPSQLIVNANKSRADCTIESKVAITKV